MCTGKMTYIGIRWSPIASDWVISHTPEGVGCGEGVSLPPLGEGSGERAVPLPSKLFDFLA